MSAFSTALVLVAFAAIWIMQFGYLYRMRKGNFQSHPLGSGSRKIETDFVTIILNAPRKAIDINLRGASAETINFSGVAGVKFRAQFEAARAHEFAHGFDMRDFLLRFRDEKEQYSVSLVKTDRSEVLLFWSAQCEPASPIIFGRWPSFESWIIRILNIRRADDFSKYCRSIYEQILSDCRSAGLEIKIL